MTENYFPRENGRTSFGHKQGDEVDDISKKCFPYPVQVQKNLNR